MLKQSKHMYLCWHIPETRQNNAIAMIRFWIAMQLQHELDKQQQFTIMSDFFSILLNIYAQQWKFNR